MGRTVTPKYRAELTFFGNTESRMAWNVRSNVGHAHGTPTAANLAKYVKALEDSSRLGGCNAHLGHTVVASARIVRQADRQCVASYRGPSFVIMD